MNLLRFAIPIVLCSVLPLRGDLVMRRELRMSATSAPIEEDKFSLGKVVSVQAGCITLREYSFARDADVEERYWVTPAAELVNLNFLADLAVGDNVVVDYFDFHGSRAVTTIVKELPCPSDGPDKMSGPIGLPGPDAPAAELPVAECPASIASAISEDRFTFAKVVAVDGNSITVREYDFTRDADVDVHYRITSETEIGLSNPQENLASGTNVILEYHEVAGERTVTRLSKEEVDPDEGLRGDQGSLVLIEANAITLRHDHGGRIGSFDRRYVVTSDTEVQILNGLGPLTAGDPIAIDFVTVAGFHGATSVLKYGDGEGVPDVKEAGKLCLPCVVSGVTVDEILFCPTDGAMAAAIWGLGECDPACVLRNIKSLIELREGDRVDVVVAWIPGKWIVFGVTLGGQP